MRGRGRYEEGKVGQRIEIKQGRKNDSLMCSGKVAAKFAKII